MTNELPNLCPRCGAPMKPLCNRWNGTKLMMLWQCQDKKIGCGKFTFYPVHTFQETFTSAAYRIAAQQARKAHDKS